ncbi:MAG: family 20 glycosylhydrolase [Microlunatus sp.]|nr:family 20 glycosylhydrolase [Microlunatus sp.]
MRRRVLTILTGLALVLAGLTAAPAAGHAATTTSLYDVVPRPVSVNPDTAHRHEFTSSAAIHVQAGSAAAMTAARYLALFLRRSTGYALPIEQVSAPASTGISLMLTGAPSSVGGQGYQLSITHPAVVIRAQKGAGLFNGVQTLHQLLPAKADAATTQPGPWVIPAGVITDHPKYPYRGAMLDVARHFFSVTTVKRYINEISLYKINYLHLHLSDDQGWRIAINGWPRLTSVGGATEVGGGRGGYYTQAQYKDIVGYAQSRNVTIVPEIDMPGHTNAALHSYGSLTCSGTAPPAYTKIGSPNTSLCVSKAVVYTFVDDVVGQLAAMTPGPYIHIGGDEAFSVSASGYRTFVNKVQAIVKQHGKTMIGWDQIAAADLGSGTVAQDWDTTHTNTGLASASNHGVKLIMSPANHVYLDQKYNKNTGLGLSWAGYVEVKDAYGWNPATYLTGGNSSAVIGVEAPLWSETLTSLRNIQYMAFPRLPAAAELGWSPRSTHDWTDFAARLGRQAPRWKVLGVNFYRSPQVPWAS